MVKKLIISLCISFILPLTQYAYATTQRSDNLIYNDTIYKVWNFQLSREMTESMTAFFDKPENRDKRMIVTSNEDGIAVALAIKNDKLYITKIEFDNYEALGRPSYKEVLGVGIPKEGLFADWYSGELITKPYSWHMNESLRTFVFENGVLKDVKGPANGFAESDGSDIDNSR